MLPSSILFIGLAAISTLTQAHLFQTPFERPDVTIAQELLYSATTQWLQAETKTMSCSSCISLLQMLKNLSYMSEGFLIATLNKVCQRTQKVDTEVCMGVVREQAPIIRKVIKTMTVSGRDGHLLCASVLNSCPYPEVEPWDVTFPKSKPESARPSSSGSGKTFTVLQLSDWHIDPDFEPGTEAFCDKPICCRAEFTDFTNITKPASMWGDYTCDTPLTLIESMLEFIPTVAPDLRFAILTGDLPPHEVWRTLPTIKTQMIQDHSYNLLHTHFDSPHLVNTMLYPAIGNHESAPTNMFPVRSSRIPIENDKSYLKLEWLYSSLAQSWQGWLSDNNILDVQRNSGSYVARPLPGLKLISLNTNFCYTLNWWLYENPRENDPNGIFQWLVDQLQDSEDMAEKVWIIGHSSPGDETCFHDYSNYFHQIIERYTPHVIAGQFYGHTHKDEFQVFYQGGEQTAENAISIAYIAPSITPFLNLNPGFRLYQVDAETFEVVDSVTYIADLDQQDTWITGPNWHVEYSARAAYNSSRAVLKDTVEPLSAAWWHNVTVDMEDDPAVFYKYWDFRDKSAPHVVECDEECRSIEICNIRGGKAEDRCDYDPDVLPDSYNKPRKQRAHSCGLNLVSVSEMDL